ncbi:MAG: hypothetical protein ABL895_05815 [Cyclobacteriaceae bacterium]
MQGDTNPGTLPNSHLLAGFAPVAIGSGLCVAWRDGPDCYPDEHLLAGRQGYGICQIEDS